ncbi:MAG: epoxide hydrolase [Actinomycetota bacterium]|nr:epoxide hydrolase [Actinomycetota bacterium]
MEQPTKISPNLDPEVLDVMVRRLKDTKWPEIVGEDSWDYGVPRNWLQDMVNYWISEWNWSSIHGEMNQWEHYKVKIDGIPIHYLHAPGQGPNPKPLILTHGWPWTFWDFKDVIGPLSDPESYGGDPTNSFDVYVPSLPGFVFSTPLPEAGIDVRRVAKLWNTLMTEILGYKKYCAHGGDWGALITAHLSHEYAEFLRGAHMSLSLIPGVNRRTLPEDAWGEDETWKIERSQEAESTIRSHVTTHLLDPQTLAYGLTDSPVATAAWIWERRRNWSDNTGDVEESFTREHLCTTASLYWCTGSIGSSLRIYHEHFKKPWPLAHHRLPRLEAPSAFAVFPKDVVHLPKSILEEYCNLRQYTVMPEGGHFAAAEKPDLIVTDICDFFKEL